MKVQRLHSYDGSVDAGKPIGPVLKVLHVTDHMPVDGPHTKKAICHLYDGSWEFTWNLKFIENEKTKPNRPEICDFDVDFEGEKWHIFKAWVHPDNSEIAWYDGSITRNTIVSERTFSPDQILVPKISPAKAYK